MARILKNTTESDINLNVLGITILANSEVELVRQWYSLAGNENSMIELSPLILSEDIVVNDGKNDLPPAIGIAHIQYGVGFIHEDIGLLPIVGDSAPALVEICPAAIGYEMQVGNKIYGQTRIDRLVGDFVQIQLHMAINNDESDKWVQFEIKYFTTNGRNDSKQISQEDGTVLTELKEVPTLPYSVFESVANIPSEVFQDDEIYLFFSVKRVTPAESKDSPENNVLALRYCKRYYQAFS